LPTPPLLLVTDRRQARIPLSEVIKQACVAGCRWISLREKDLSEQEQIAMFESLRATIQQYGARATIHGSAQCAKSAAANGVHLAAGEDPAATRAALGRQALIGLSVHNASELDDLASGTIDYVVAGPAYETAGKPGYGPPLGSKGIAAIVAASDVPVIAIGGVAPQNASELISAGAAGIAVMGSVMRSTAPGHEILQLLDVLARHSCSHSEGRHHG
jgi:thiamine-phosphate pyrophosphorylase